MALDPNIALQVKPMELVDPLASYGRVAAIQNAQNQNALAQYQLGAAQRAEQRDVSRMNALAQAGTDNKAIANALLRSGDLKGYSEFVKTIREADKADVDLVDAKLKQSRLFLENVTTPEQYLAWHESNHRDPVLGPVLASRGITAESSRARIEQALKTPGGFQELLNQSKLGTEKFMELNKPQFTSQNLGGTTRIVQTPGLGGATTVVPGSTASVTMTPYERERIAQENKRLDQDATGVVYQEDANGNIIALPSKLKAGQVPVARPAMAPGGGMQPLTAKPSEAVGKEQMSINQQRAIVKGAIDAVTTTPDAFGMTRGLVGETIGGRMGSSEENQARAFLFNVVSGVIKERAGTAQSAAEADTLNRFLPQPTDSAEVIKDKMVAFDKYLVAKETGTTKKKPTAPARELSAMDKAALDWANSNPSDPRATQIKQRLGM